MLANLSNHKIQNLVELKNVIMKIWDEMPITAVCATCDGFENRLKLVKQLKWAIRKSFGLSKLNISEVF